MCLKQSINNDIIKLLMEYDFNLRFEKIYNWSNMKWKARKTGTIYTISDYPKKPKNQCP